MDYDAEFKKLTQRVALLETDIRDLRAKANAGSVPGGLGSGETMDATIDRVTIGTSGTVTAFGKDGKPMDLYGSRQAGETDDAVARIRNAGYTGEIEDMRKKATSAAQGRGNRGHGRSQTEVTEGQQTEGRQAG